MIGGKGLIGVEIEGIQGLMNDFKGYEKEAEKAINTAIGQTALAIETDAKNRLRGMLGSAKHTIHGGAGLLGSIYNRVVKSMEKVVGSDKHYAPYIEFGTGNLVFTNFDFDESAKKVAANFKGRGVRKVNIRGDSFLNWAAVNQEKKHIERLERELNKINR